MAQAMGFAIEAQNFSPWIRLHFTQAEIYKRISTNANGYPGRVRIQIKSRTTVSWHIKNRKLLKTENHF
jgi:hypothetical protein